MPSWHIITYDHLFCGSLFCYHHWEKNCHVMLVSKELHAISNTLTRRFKLKICSLLLRAKFKFSMVILGAIEAFLLIFLYLIAAPFLSKCLPFYPAKYLVLVQLWQCSVTSWKSSIPLFVSPSVQLPAENLQSTFSYSRITIPLFQRSCPNNANLNWDGAFKSLPMP